MNSIQYLSSRPRRIINYILECHKQWSDGRFDWITTNYEGLKELSHTELVEVLNKEGIK